MDPNGPAMVTSSDSAPKREGCSFDGYPYPCPYKKEEHGLGLPAGHHFTPAERPVDGENCGACSDRDPDPASHVGCVFARPPAPAEEVVRDWSEDIVLHRALHRSKPGPWEVCNAVYHMSMTNYEHVIATLRRLP